MSSIKAYEKIGWIDRERKRGGQMEDGWCGQSKSLTQLDAHLI